MSESQPDFSPQALSRDWQIIAEWDWLWLENAQERADQLHAVKTLDNPDSVGEEWMGTGATECGQHGQLWIPGLFDRMAAERCPACCEATGMPPGKQSPKNVEECRPLVEQRLKAKGLK